MERETGIEPATLSLGTFLLSALGARLTYRFHSPI